MRRLIANVVFLDNAPGVSQKKRGIHVNVSVFLLHLLIQMSDGKPDSLFPNIARPLFVRRAEIEKTIGIHTYNSEIAVLILFMQCDPLK
jgi:hypothetical protein